MKKFKKQLKESTIVTIYKNNDVMYATPNRIITKKEKEIILLMIEKLPCNDEEM